MAARAAFHNTPAPIDAASWAWRRATALVATDVLALLASVAVGVVLASAFVDGAPGAPVYRAGAAAVLLSVLCYAVAGLYTGILPSPPDETRKLGLATTGAFGGVTLVTGLLLEQAALPALALAFAWGATALSVLVGRAFLRHFCAHRPWWQRPVVVLGAGPMGCHIVRTLLGQPERGLRPVALVDDDPERHGGTVEGVPVVGYLAHATYYSQEGVPLAIAELPASEDREHARRIEFCTSGFRSVVFASGGFSELPNRWARSQSLGGIAGLEMHQRRHSRWRRFLKRAFDVAVSLALLVATLPLSLLVALLIKLESDGPVFYRQARLGRGGRRFEVLKFRSMYTGADKRLEAVLESDPEARAEFETFQKLSNDPRVTRVGRILRKTSLDEIPQLWNVLRNEMSLVGPRAYLPSELSKMKRLDNLILRSAPGMTGLWQISGRNQLSFETRVDLEASYVRNWSLLYDIYLLVHTIPVVLLGHGAR